MDPQDQEPRRVLERRPSPAGLKDALAFQRHPLRTLERGHRSGGELFGLTSFAGGRMLVIATPELREILPQIVERFVLAPVGPVAPPSRLYGTALVPARGARVVLHDREGASSRGLLRHFDSPQEVNDAVEAAAPGAGQTR